jgi:uncharacterized protein YabN with tetrapyrrole methylase and pyrophosphatase domain
MKLNRNELVNDFFASRLLETLPNKDVLFAAYEAQDISRLVGFDFTNINQVRDRALDEVREAKEAYEAYENEMTEINYIHLGDEIADIVFSFINLARHKGIFIEDLPNATSVYDASASSSVDLNHALDEIKKDIDAICISANIQNTKNILFDSLSRCAQIALDFNFDFRDIMHNNVKKYLERCQVIERLAKADNKNWGLLATNDEILLYWKKAKDRL